MTATDTKIQSKGVEPTVPVLTLQQPGARQQPPTAIAGLQAGVGNAALAAAASNGSPGSSAPLFPVQSTYGNAAASRSLQPRRTADSKTASRPFGAPTSVQPLPAHRRIPLQPKLTVGSAHDPYEQEADRVAKQVMRMPTPPTAATGQTSDKGHIPEHDEMAQTKPLAATITPLAQRAPSDSAGSFEPGADFESRLSTNGSGSPLPASTRAFMEPRFGADFSGVRLHKGSEATQLNRAINAQAFTHGRDIYLGEGKNNLESSAGKQLLAHELTHTIQQGANATLDPARGRLSPAALRPSQGAMLQRSPGDGGKDPIHDPIVEEYRKQHGLPPSGVDENGNPVGPSDAEIKYGNLNEATKPAAGAAAATAAPAANPGAATEDRQLAAFDVGASTKRPWNLDKLSKDIATALDASPRAYVRIYGVYPTVANDDNPKQHAYDRADTVRKALIQWIGKRFSEDRYDVAFSDGGIGDPNVQVWIAYKPEVISDPKTPLPPGPKEAPGPKKADAGAGMQIAAGFNYGWHLNVSGPKGTSKDRTLQLQFGDDFFVQLSYNLDTNQVQVLGGIQATGEVEIPDWMPDMVKKMVAVSGFVQIAAGVARSGTGASGSSAVLQPSASGQLEVKVTRWLKLSLQIAGSTTVTTGQPTTVEANITPVVTVQF